MLIYLSMIFVAFETLSILFNQYFLNIDVIGIKFPLNISVIFFCFDFFILDVVTEIFNKKTANKLINGKIICQIIFVLFGAIGIIGSGQQGSQLSQIIKITPFMIFNSVIASVIGYKITISLMQKLKVFYHGKYLIFRYLFSVLPGEIVFSLIFSALSFSHGRNLEEFTLIFMSLTTVKIVFSLFFSGLLVPITNILRNFNEESSSEWKDYEKVNIQS